MRPDTPTDASSLYTQQVPINHHFVEVYLEHMKADANILALYEKPKRRNSLEKLLTGNLDEAALLQNFNLRVTGQTFGEAVKTSGNNAQDRKNDTETIASVRNSKETSSSKKSGAKGRSFPPNSRVNRITEKQQ